MIFQTGLRTIFKPLDNNGDDTADKTTITYDPATALTDLVDDINTNPNPAAHINTLRELTVVVEDKQFGDKTKDTLILKLESKLKY